MFRSLQGPHALCFALHFIPLYTPIPVPGGSSWFSPTTFKAAIPNEEQGKFGIRTPLALHNTAAFKVKFIFFILMGVSVLHFFLVSTF